MRAEWMRWFGILGLVLTTSVGLSSCKNGSSSGGGSGGGCGSEGCQLVAPDRRPIDTFGFKLDIEDDVVVVGSASGTNGDDRGAAYVYRWDGALWVFEQKLIATDATGGDLFGSSVAISGNVIAVGAFSEDSNLFPSTITNNGAVYIFRFDGTTWNQEAKILAADRANSDLFGVSVDIEGDTVVIGSFLDDDNGTDSGSAYVFRFNGAAWLLEQKLTASSAAAFDRFGISVAIDGSVAVVGAYRDDDGGANAGSAFVFRRAGVTWTQEQRLNATDAGANDEFGFSTDVSGDVIVVGAHLDNTTATDTGSAYVFGYNGVTWTQMQKLTSSDAAAFDSFGIHVSIDDELVAIGASRDDDDGVRSGSAYTFRFEGGSWTEAEKLRATDASTGDHFGVSTAVNGDLIAVGAHQAGPATTRPGPPTCSSLDEPVRAAPT